MTMSMMAWWVCSMKKPPKYSLTLSSAQMLCPHRKKRQQILSWPSPKLLLLLKSQLPLQGRHNVNPQVSPNDSFQKDPQRLWASCNGQWLKIKLRKRWLPNSNPLHNQTTSKIPARLKCASMPQKQCPIGMVTSAWWRKLTTTRVAPTTRFG